MFPGILRLKLLLAERGRLIAGILVVIGLLALVGGAWAYTHPPVETVTEETDVQTIRTDVETSAIVTGESSLWGRGERIEGGSFYPSTAPTLRFQIATVVPAEQEVSLDQELSLRYEATRDGTTIWRSEQVITRATPRATEGEAVLTGRIDTRAIRDRQREINRELTGIGASQVFIVVNTSYQTETYAGTLSETTRLSVAERGYWLAGSLDSERTHSRTVTRAVTRPPDMTVVSGVGGLGLLSLLTAGLVWGSQRRLPTPDAIRDRLERSRYEEWISTVDFGGELPDRRLRLRTLGGLVNLGIDSNKRVFYDPDRGLYGVIDGEVLYYYIEIGGEPLDTGPEDQWEWPFEEPDDTTPETPPSNLQRIE